MSNIVEKAFTFDDGEFNIFVYNWIPKNGIDVKGVIQIAHGMGEQANRFMEFAYELVRNGYIVYANDHRGHGKTAGVQDNLGYIGDKDGFEKMTLDLFLLTELIKKEHPSLPLILFGHSMGAMLTQNYITKYGELINGAILSGTAGKKGLRPDLHDFVKEEIKDKGADHRSEKIVDLHFGEYNRYFAPNQTDFDFMSRDLSVVNKYLSDPLNGFVFPLGFYNQLYEGISNLYEQNKLERIPKSMPIYLFSGDRDPVGVFGKEVKELEDMYIKLGISDVKCDLYEGGRHEMLNEINKKEVISNVVKWIDEKCVI